MREVPGDGGREEEQVLGEGVILEGGEVEGEGVNLLSLGVRGMRKGGRCPEGKGGYSLRGKIPPGRWTVHYTSWRKSITDSRSGIRSSGEWCYSSRSSPEG